MSAQLFVPCPNERCGVRNHVVGSGEAQRCNLIGQAQRGSGALPPVAALTDKAIDYGSGSFGGVFIESTPIGPMSFQGRQGAVKYSVLLETDSSDEPTVLACVKSLDQIERSGPPTAQEVLVALAHGRRTCRDPKPQDESGGKGDRGLHLFGDMQENDRKLAHLLGKNTETLRQAVMADEGTSYDPDAWAEALGSTVSSTEGGSTQTGPEFYEQAVDSVLLPKAPKRALGRLLDRIRPASEPEFEDDITQNERDAAFSYASDSYSGPLNEALRSGELPPGPVAHLQEHLDSLISKRATKRAHVFYRAVTGIEMKEGSEVIDDGFMSVTTDERFAQMFLRHRESQQKSKGRVVEITAPAGTNYAMGSAKATELILERGSRLRIDSAQGNRIKATLLTRVV